MIPRILHRVWLGPDMPERYREFGTRWHELHPGWMHILWGGEIVGISDSTIWRDADQIVCADPVQLRTDIARYYILKSYGGVYVDCDTEPFAPLDDLCKDTDCWFAWEQDQQWVGNAYIGAVPNHTFIHHLLEGIPKSVRANYGRTRANAISGPQYVTKKLKHWHGSSVKVYPQAMFYPYNFDELDRATGQPFPGAVAAHHWNNRRRKTKQPL